MINRYPLSPGGTAPLPFAHWTTAFLNSCLGRVRRGAGSFPRCFMLTQERLHKCRL